MTKLDLYKNIDRLLAYGTLTGLLQEEDVIYSRNQLLELFEEPDYEETPIQNVSEEDLEDILKQLLDYAAQTGILKEDSIVYRDLLDTRIMNCLMPRPSEVVRSFRQLYETSPVDATQWYYKLSQDSDYIRRYRIKKDMRWSVASPYGEIDISINLSKPEKDPKAIAAAKNMKQSGYPKCLLCKENVGYAGRVNHPARQNHRTIPVTIGGKGWGLQYSPYVYYNEHCILFCNDHVPMKIEQATFEKLFGFVEQFPHYFLGSNADLPIVGGSILAHDHYQGGNYTFAMAKAKMEETFTVEGFENVEAGIVNWPLSVIRLRCKETAPLIQLGTRILDKWRTYTDEEAFLFAETEGEPHNTITPIARKNGEMYELDLALRNNITTKEHPLGVYHPHEAYHHIKKENIGLIEVMGLAILPARLKQEMEEMKTYLLSEKDFMESEALQKHAEWLQTLREKYIFTEENIERIVKEEIGQVFVKVLEDAGVFKCTEEGRANFRKFISYI